MTSKPTSSRFLRTITKDKKPPHWGPHWPVRILTVRHDAHADRVFRFLQTVRDAEYDLILCVDTNKKLLNLQQAVQRELPWARTFRYVSKAQHLIERLAEIGIDFEPLYYTASSPYALGGLDEPSTIEALRTALVAKGLDGDDAESVFEQEYTDWVCDLPNQEPWDLWLTRSDPAPNNVNVWLFTSTALNARLTGFRSKWYEPLNIRKQFALIYVDPDPREFDEFRYVHPDDAEVVRTARKKYPKFRLKRQKREFWTTQTIDVEERVSKYSEETLIRTVRLYSDEDSAMFAEREHTAQLMREQTPIHETAMRDGRLIEYRPRSMEFWMRFYWTAMNSRKMFVLTTKQSIIDDVRARMRGWSWPLDVRPKYRRPKPMPKSLRF